MTKVNKRSSKKYHRGICYGSTDAHLYFICLLGVALRPSLIGLAVLGEIFLFFPSDMIRFVETRVKQRGDVVLNHRYFPAQWFSLLFARKRQILETSSYPSIGNRTFCNPEELKCSYLSQQGHALKCNKLTRWPGKCPVTNILREFGSLGK